MLTELQEEHAKIQFDLLDTNGNGTIEVRLLQQPHLSIIVFKLMQVL